MSDPSSNLTFFYCYCKQDGDARLLREMAVTIHNGNTGFVGREQELATLLRCLDEAAGGRGRLVLVAGEPGIGKTRLLAELSERAQAEGWQVLIGHAYDSEGMPPYLPFSEALRDYVRPALLDDLSAQLDEAGPEVALLAPDIRRRLPDLAASPPASPDDQRYRLFESVSDFLLGIPGRAEARGLVLILDDLHWAEQSSVLLLQHLVRRLTGASLLIVGVYRTAEVSQGHPLTALLAEQRRGGVAQRLQLAPLTAVEVAALVGEMTGGAPAVEVVEAIARQTEGNPFFVGEVVRNLMTEGRDLTLAEAATAVEGVPAGVREVIERRLERLSVTANGLLRMGAVLGDGFSFELLQATLGSLPLTDASRSDSGEARYREGGGEGTNLLDALDEALATGMLREAGRVYKFSHALIRQALYDGLSLARRQRLHQQVARTLEQQYAGRLGDHAAELAEHFARSTDASDLAKAVGYAELAADRAMAVYAYGEAARHLEQALRVQGLVDPAEMAKRCDLLLSLGEILPPAGEGERAIGTVAEDALRLAEQLGDHSRASRACRLVWNSSFAVGGAGLARPEAQRWAELADRYAEPESLDRVYADLFLSQVSRSDEVGRRYNERAAELAQQLGDPNALVMSLFPVISGWRLPPEAYEDRIRAAESLASLPLQGANNARLAVILGSAGDAFLAWGRRAEAEAMWRRSAEVVARSRDAGVLNMPLIQEAMRGILDGRLEQVVEVGKRLRARAAEHGRAEGGRAEAAWITRRALLYLGRVDEALSGIPDSGDDLFAAGGGGDAAQRALFLAHAGYQDRAAAMLKRLLDSRDLTETAVLRYLLEASVVLMDREAARSLEVRMAPVAGLLVTDGLMWYCIGRLCGGAAALLGERQKARGYYEQAVKVCTHARFRPELALTRLELAALLLDESTKQQPSAEALEHLEFAVAELEEMGMQPALTRARALQSSIDRAKSLGPVAENPDGLTAREIEVLRLVAAGMSNLDIAAALVISVNTVFHHVRSILSKTGTANRTRAAAYALHHGLVE